MKKRLKSYVAIVDSHGNCFASCSAADIERNLHHIIRFVVKHYMDGDEIYLVNESKANKMMIETQKRFEE